MDLVPAGITEKRSFLHFVEECFMEKNLLFSKDAFVRTNKNITKDRGPS